MKIVLHSNVILDIIDLYKNQIKSPRNQKEKRVFEIKDMIERHTITPIVTPTIKREIVYGSKFDGGFGEAYLSKYFKEIEFDDYMESKTLVLADGYGNYPITGVNDYAIPLAENYLCRNYNTAKIIGEVAVLQKKFNKKIPLISNCNNGIIEHRKINFINTRHDMADVYIYSYKGLGHAVHIAKINEQSELE